MLGKFMRVRPLRKILFVVLSVVLLITLAGCGEKEATQQLPGSSKETAQPLDISNYGEGFVEVANKSDKPVRGLYVVEESPSRYLFPVQITDTQGNKTMIKANLDNPGITLPAKSKIRFNLPEAVDYAPRGVNLCWEQGSFSAGRGTGKTRGKPLLGAGKFLCRQGHRQDLDYQFSDFFSKVSGYRQVYSEVGRGGKPRPTKAQHHNQG